MIGLSVACGNGLTIWSRHHEERLAVTLEACAQPASGIDVLNKMFTRKLDDHQIFFAVGEALAHLNRLMYKGRISRSLSPEGIYLYKAREQTKKLHNRVAFFCLSAVSQCYD